jgi:threonine dehydrogenase-like Zn-dependent dehydrogenase
MCRNGRYTERGIKELHGYASELWTVPAEFVVRVASHLGVTGVLTEPTSVVAKAWEQVERVGQRAWFSPRRALITGAGPIGLLAALLAV